MQEHVSRVNEPQSCSTREGPLRKSKLALMWLVMVVALGCSPRAPKEPPAEDRTRRQEAVAAIAPAVIARPSPSPAPSDARAPAPAECPGSLGGGKALDPKAFLLGDEGVDRDGYPKRFVDRAALRSLLQHRCFVELSGVVEWLQDEFEADSTKEFWPGAAAEALGTGEVSQRPLLDAWVEASPGSFAPVLARGTHWVSNAFLRRGGRWANETSDEDMRSMEEAAASGLVDLERAVALRPKLVAAMRGQLNALMVSSGGRQRMEAVVERALSVCPRCFQIRATYLTSLEPRWGGSHRAMAAFIASHPNRKNPRLRLLPGYIDLDRARTLRGEKDAAGALAAVERALARGESWEFLLERARIHRGQKELEAALSDLTQAAALRPGIADVIYERADILLRLRRWEEAGRDLRVALQLDPADTMGRRLLPDVVQGLVYAGVQRRDAGDSDGALERLDLAAELAPERRDIQQHRAWIVLNRAGPDAGASDVGALDVGSSDPGVEVPDDFRAVQALDYRLARERKFERIVPLWDAFLARHPDHGQAHLERSGTLYHLKRFAEAREGASRACDLGVSEGCLRAKQLANAR
jgi:hypothetical protein